MILAPLVVNPTPIRWLTWARSNVVSALVGTVSSINHAGYRSRDRGRDLAEPPSCIPNLVPCGLRCPFYHRLMQLQPHAALCYNPVMSSHDLTPARRQYLAFKKKYPHAILFFRMGDF